MKLIPLTQGKFAKVDDKDYARVAQFKWCAHKHRGNWYARRGVRIGNKVKGIKMHRFIVAAPSDVDVDHRDLDGLNNQRSNIRTCSNGQNALNKRKQDGKFTSRFKGVSRRENTSKWRAAINVSGVRVRLGTFVTERAAAEAYDLAAQKYHGEFARLNFKN